jgi:type I restriction enzyme S subunit
MKNNMDKDLPDGWEIKKLGDVSLVGSGNSAPQNKELFKNGKYLFIRTSDVGKIKKGSIVLSNDLLNEKGILKLKLHKSGTILFPKSGASTFLNHRVIMNVDGYVSSHLATIKPNKEVENKYIWFYLITIDAKDLMQDVAYPSLKLSDIKQIKIPIPPLKQQQQIVAILDKAFIAIDTAKNNAEQNLINAKQLFESYLQDIFNNKGDDWIEKKLDDICKVEYGTRVVRKRDGGTIYPVYGGGGATFSMDIFNRQDCLIVARFAMSKKCTRFVNGKFFLNDSGLSVNPKNDKEICQEFLNLQFLHLNDYIYSLARGTAQKNLNVPIFRKINIKYPKTIKQQQQIVAILDKAFIAIDTAKATAEQNLINAKEIFASYLQDIFNNKGDDWIKKRFDEICVLQRGFDLPKRLRNEGIYPLVSSNGITDYIDIWKVKSPGVSTGRSGTIGKVHFIEKDYFPLNTSLYIKEFHGNNERCIYYFLKKFDLSRFKSGAGVPTLNRNNVHCVKIYFPKSIQEQQKIVKKLNALQSETKKLEVIYQQKIDDLIELKKSTLQKAFNGEL